MSRILILDDNQKILDTLSRNFGSVGIECATAPDISTASGILQCCPIDLAIVDIKIGEESGIDALTMIKKMMPDLPVLMITGFATVETAVQAIKLGANEYLKKPVRFPTLLEQVKALLREESRELPAIPEIQTRNSRMVDVIKKSLKLAQSNLSVLILGESGTGKELLADLIHKYSPREEKNFVKINCAAFPESLLDNELFGHEKGSYTGANDCFKGVFEQADNGSLFLDELGDMPLSIQAKILRAIQENEIRRLGGKEIIKINVRFIAATNRNLEELVSDKLFRSDLYYRLNCASVYIPPLRDRKEDIPLLIDYFLNRYSDEEAKPRVSISDQAMELLLNYDWPGNVRELKAAVNYGATICSNGIMLPEDLPMSHPVKTIDETATLTPVMAVEKELIIKTLIRHSYNKKKAAEELSISRTTLYSKMTKYGITDVL